MDSLAIQECTGAIKAAFGGGSSGCFPSIATVCKRGVGTVSMAELRIGDEILVADSYGNLIYEPVITFLHLFHASRNVLFDYLQINHSSGHILIHPDHLISVTRRGQTTYLPAHEIRRTDFISAVWLDGSFTLSSVSGVERVSKKGLYCPLTYSGTVIVDGVLCSCYSPPSAFLGYRCTHEAAHVAVLPLRLQSAGVGPGTEGIHPYCQALMYLTS
jgi:Hint module